MIFKLELRFTFQQYFYDGSVLTFIVKSFEILLPMFFYQSTLFPNQNFQERTYSMSQQEANQKLKNNHEVSMINLFCVKHHLGLQQEIKSSMFFNWPSVQFIMACQKWKILFAAPGIRAKSNCMIFAQPQNLC